MPVMENATWNNEMWVNRKEFYYVIFAIIIPLYIHLLGTHVDRCIWHLLSPSLT